MRLLLLLSACAFLFDPDTRRPEKPLPCAQGWRTVETKHFIVYSDRSDTIAREAAVELEKVFRAFADAPLLVPAPSPPTGRITVVIFRSMEEFLRLQTDPHYAAGYHEVHNLVEPLPTIVMVQEPGFDQRERLVHELSHRFVLHAAPAAPRWLLEGLADYVSSLELSEDVVRVGEMPRKFYNWPRYIFPRKEILKVTYGESHVPDFYAGAFSLVHLLNDTQEGQQAFREYLTLLGQGVARRRRLRARLCPHRLGQDRRRPLVVSATRRVREAGAALFAAENRPLPAARGRPR
jgi:hypothetical protein